MPEWILIRIIGQLHVDQRSLIRAGHQIVADQTGLDGDHRGLDTDVKPLGGNRLGQGDVQRIAIGVQRK